MQAKKIPFPRYLFINFALSMVGKKQLKAVREASKDCKRASLGTLRSILNYAKDSEWGRAHGFADILEAGSDEELVERWQRHVPPAGYEDFRPYVERHKRGEENVLFPGKPKMYATTSGTTSEPKWIPITNEYYDNIYNKMSTLWLYTFIMHRKRSFRGRTISIVGKSIEGYAPDGTVYGSVSGVTRRDIPAFLNIIHSSPADVFDISDYSARYYTIIRTAMEQDVRCIVTANPSTIVEMQNNVEQYFDEYVADIEHGTLNAKLDIPESVRRVLAPTYRPNPARARELRELKARHGKVLPKHYWPHMTLLTTWKCGNTKIYTEKFEHSFPEGMLYQEFSYFASECRAGLVLDGGDSTVLFPHFHYFEFVEEAELESEVKHFRQVYELEQGKRYSVFVTTYAGLYRYDMNDLVEVTGFFGTIPTIQFVQKINGIISMTGEKVHERQFMQAVKNAEKATGLKTTFYIGFADLQNSTYQLYYEFASENLSGEEAARFNNAVDSELKQLNIEYEAKRDSLRLKAPVPHLLVKDSFEKFKEASLKQGARDGQFKLNLLMQDERRHAMFKQLVK